MMTHKIRPIGVMVLELGLISVTRRVPNKLTRCQVNDALTRHMIGDWGEVNEDQWRANDEALRGRDAPILSSFIVDEQHFLIITQADRSETLVLLSDEHWEFC